MKIARFKRGDRIQFGVIEAERVQALKDPFFSTLEPQGPDMPLSEIEILAPCEPTKVVAVGLNYRTHAEELGMALPEEPLLFLKPSSAVIGPGVPILIPKMSQRVDYEGELAVIVGRQCRNVNAANAADYILGYTCLNDVTARDLQKKDGQFTRSKSFDTFAPLGPFVETGLDPDDVRVETFLNGEKRQSTSTRDLIFSVVQLVCFISQIMTLYPGDVIATGTPSGIGPMQAGDVVEICIEGIGTLRNPVEVGSASAA